MEQKTKGTRPHYVLEVRIFRLNPDKDNYEPVERDYTFEGDDLHECAKQAAAAFAERIEKFDYGDMPQRVNRKLADMSYEEISGLEDTHICYGDEYTLNVYRVTGLKRGDWVKLYSHHGIDE